MNKKIYFIIILIFTINVSESHLSDNFIFSFLTIFILTLFLWIYKLMDNTLVCILFLILVISTGILDVENALSGLGEPIIWMVLSFLIISNALKETKLEKTFSYLLSKFSNNKVSTIFILISLINFTLALLIPNAVIRLNILQDITLRYRQKNSKLSAALTLFITFAPYLTTTLTITASTGTLLALTLYEEIYDYSWNYFLWFILITPVYIISIISTAIIILKYFGITKNETIEVEHDSINDKLVLRKDQVKLLVVYAITISMFFTTSYHNISIYLISIIAMFIIHIPPLKVVEWRTSIKSVNWNVLLMFATSFAIAKSFEASGLLNKITKLYNSYGNMFHEYIMLTILISFIVLIRLFFTNFNSFIAAFFPLVLSFSSQGDFSTIWMSFLLFNIMSIGFILPSQSIGSMITLQEGKYTYRDHVQVGYKVTIILIISYITFGFLYWIHLI